MTDITDLFHHVAPTIDDPSEETIAADIARGRQALARDHRRRTIRRSMAATTTIAAAAVVVLIAAQLNGPGPANRPTTATPTTVVQPTPHHPATSTGHKPAGHKAAAIKLVAYNGQQLHGFTVAKVPDGWVLSTSTQYALLIDPKGDNDNDPDAFEGKLAVLTQSQDVNGLPKGTPVTVNGQRGVVTDQGKYGLSLTYNDPAGFGVVIQAPPTLNWTDSQLVTFAEGVHETSDALQGRG
jgi:hypothetical protein